MSHASSVPTAIIAVDPGRDKCGIAVLRADGSVLSRAVVPRAEVADAVARLLDEHHHAALVVGDRTGARDVSAAISARSQVSPALVDEHGSTLQGRRRYFQENPPRGWRRLVPVGLQTPPHPYDDYVAVILAERYLASRR